MRQIVLDASSWLTEADLIEAVVSGLDGPSWHGRNYNALRDSMVTGSINGIEPPYEIVFTRATSVGPEIDAAIRFFVSRVTERRTSDGAKIWARVAE